MDSQLEMPSYYLNFIINFEVFKVNLLSLSDNSFKYRDLRALWLSGFVRDSLLSFPIEKISINFKFYLLMKIH